MTSNGTALEAAQLSIFEDRDGWRYQAFVTNTSTRTAGFSRSEARHRAHARVDDRIRPAKRTRQGVPVPGICQGSGRRATVILWRPAVTGRTTTTVPHVSSAPARSGPYLMTMPRSAISRNRETMRCGRDAGTPAAPIIMF